MRLVFLFSLLIASILTGAEGGKHTFRVLFLDAPNDAPKKLHLFDGEKSQEIELPRMNLSPVYELPAGDLTIVLSSNPYSLPEEVQPNAPKQKVPVGVSDFYLLIASDKSNSVAPVVMQLVPVDESKFKKGEMMWFNLTKNVVGGKVGTQKLVMKPQSQKILLAPASKNEDFVVDLAFQMPGDKELYPLCETKWIHDPRARKVVFVTNEEGRRTPRVRGFSDFRSEKKS